MWASLREYHRPTTIRAALHLLNRPSPHTSPLAGGTWLVAARDPIIQAVVDLRGLSLDFTEPRKGSLRVGAMVTLQNLVTHSTVRHLAGGLLADAAQRSGSRAIRNMATLGGTLAIGGSTSEVALALLVLNARVVIRTPERRSVKAEQFLKDPGKYLYPAGLIIEIVIPEARRGSGGALAGVSCTSHAPPIVNAAALVVRRRDVCHSVRLALGGIASVPVRLTRLEAMLTGHHLEDTTLEQISRAATDSIAPASDRRTSADYRREMASVLAVRALRYAWERAGQE